jgi:geranylgeranyl pyrophosphate synthase
MAVELTHAATLVHDDVIDRSATRRGMPTVVALQGEETAIVVGDYYFAKAYAEASRTGSAEVVGILAGAVQSICEGELLQQADRFDYRPSSARYSRRIRHKTAALLAACCRIGARLGGLERDQERSLGDFGDRIGRAFQIVDDVLDYVGTEAELGKPTGHDLLEGSATLPLMLAREDPAVAAELDALLVQGRELAAPQVALVVELVRESRGPARALQRARRLGSRAVAELDRFRGRPAAEALVGLAGYVVERNL